MPTIPLGSPPKNTPFLDPARPGAISEPWLNWLYLVGGRGFQPWVPALAGSGAMTVSGVGVTFANFSQIGSLCHVEASISFSTGGTPATSITLTLPFAYKGAAGLAVNVITWGTTGVPVFLNSVGMLAAGSNLFTIYAGADSVTNFSAGAHILYLNFSFRIA